MSCSNTTVVAALEFFIIHIFFSRCENHGVATDPAGCDIPDVTAAVTNMLTPVKAEITRARD
jgi:hypothetical protein